VSQSGKLSQLLEKNHLWLGLLASNQRVSGAPRPIELTVGFSKSLDAIDQHNWLAWQFQINLLQSFHIYMNMMEQTMDASTNSYVVLDIRWVVIAVNFLIRSASPDNLIML
jgi:hypothetical protein